MHKLKSGDSAFIFSFDKKLFEKEESCVEYEFETLKEGDWLNCIYIPKTAIEQETLSIFQLTYNKKYKIEQLKSAEKKITTYRGDQKDEVKVEKRYYYRVKNDEGKKRLFPLASLESYFEVIPRTQLFLMPETYEATSATNTTNASSK